MNAMHSTDWYVVPCGAAKLDRPAAAGDLYTGPHFRFVLTAVQAHAARLDALTGRPARVLILSALHGLVSPGQMLAPYDVMMGAPSAITVGDLAGTARVQGLTRGDTITAFLPGTYFRALEDAAAHLNMWALNAFIGARGIGDQRGIISGLARLTDAQVLAGATR